MRRDMDLGGRDSKSPKKFLIPRVSRTQTEGFQHLLEPESIPGKSITALIEGSATLEEKFKWSSHWSLRTITQVCNSNFQQRFLEKKVELLKEVKQFKEYFAYGLTQSDTEANNICSNGAFAGQILNFPLGDVEHGVNVCQYPDVLLRWAEKKGFKQPCIVIYKILKGRCKTVNARTSFKQQMVEPTPNLEYHIANGIPTPEEPLFMQLSKSQLFLYEYDDDALPAKHPRHCLPYAVISLKKRTQSPPLPPLTDKEQSRCSASKTSRDLASTELDRNNNRRKVKEPADLPTVGKISKMSAHSKPTSRNPQENQSYVTSGMESLDNDEKKTGATKNLPTMENEARPEVRMKLSDRFAPTSSAMDDPKLDSLRQEHLKMLEKLKAVRVERMNNSLLGFRKTSQDEQRSFKNEHLKTATTNCSSNKPEATPKTVPQLSSLKITINNDTREQITSSNSSVGKNTQVSADQIPHNNSECLSDRSERCVSHRSNKNKNRNRTTNYQTQAPFRGQNKTFGPRGGRNNMSYRGVAQRGRNRAGFLNRRRMPFHGSQDFKRYNRTHNFNMGEQHEHVGSFNRQTQRAWREECPSDYYSHNEQDSAHFMQGGSNFRGRGKRMPRRACRGRFVQCSNPRIQPSFPKPRFQNNRKQRSMKRTETFRFMRDSSNNSSKIDSSVLSCQHSVGNTVETSKRQIPRRASLTDVGGHNHDKEPAQSDLDDYESSPSQHETPTEPSVEEIRSGLKRNGKYYESAKVEISDQPSRAEFIGLYDNISSDEESCVKTLCVDDLEVQDMDYDSGESLSAKLPQTGGSQIDPSPTLHCNLSSQTNNTHWEHGDLATEQQHYTLNNTSHPNSNTFAYRFPQITGVQRLQSRTPCVGPSSSYGCQPNSTQQYQTGEQLISEQAHRVPTEFFEQRDSYSSHAQQLQTDDSTNLMTTAHGCESCTTESPQAYVPNGPVQEPSNMQNSYALLQNNFPAHSYASQAPALPCPSKMQTSNAEVKPDTALPNSLSNMDSNAQNYPTGEQTNWNGQQGCCISTAQHPHDEPDPLTPTFSGSPYSDMSISMSMSKGSKEGICPPDLPYDVGSDSFINNPHMLASALEYCNKNYKQTQARRNSQGSCTSRVSMDEIEAPTESKQKLFYGRPLITKKGGKPCEVLLDNIPGLPKPVDPRAALSALFGRRFQIELKQVNFSSDFSSESDGVNAINSTTVTQTTERKRASGRQNSRDPRLINNKVKKDTNKEIVLTAGIASEVYSSTNLVTAPVQPNQDSSGLESVQSFLEPQKGNSPGNMPLLTPNESTGHRTSFICSSEKPTISSESSHDTLITSNPLELESCAEAQPNPDNQPVATIKSEAPEDITHYIPEISVDNQVPERKSTELHLLGKIALKVRKLRHGLNAPKPSSSEQPPKPNDTNTSSFLLQKLEHVSCLDVGMHPKPTNPVNHDDGTEQESKCLSDKTDSSSESSNNVSCRGISSINPSPGESCEQCAVRRLSPLKGSKALCNKGTSSASSCTSSIGMENRGNSRLSPLSSSVQEERSTSQGSTTCERNQLSSEISCDLTARRRSLPSRSTSKYSESRSNRKSRSPRRRSRSPCRRSRSPIQSSRSPTRSSRSPRRRSRSPTRRSRSPWRGSRSPRRRSRSPTQSSLSPRRRSRSPRRRSRSPRRRSRSPTQSSRSPRRRSRSPTRSSRSPRRSSTCRSPTRKSRSPTRRSRSLCRRSRSPRRRSRSPRSRGRSPNRSSRSPHSRGRSPRRRSRSPRRRGRSPRRRGRSPRRRSRSPRRRSRSPTRRSRSPRRRSRSLSQRRRSPRSCRGSRSPNTRNRSPISQQGSSVMMGTTQLRDFLPNQSEAAQNCSFRIEVRQDIRKVIVRNVETEVLESQCGNWQEYRAANPTTQNADFQQRNI
ncbi:serine/arginine repetitive matrix protein 2-like isoform X2 [Asterias rubens]|uniref:serine/arginine repetitive matrix protein 2-like isoform X2 n=1 Tax=Asterias rubens TaxID=7604 RepID=UPI001454F554|nr:serine/arginine repetitive matrix protein 2-like isoform X2 [Asterias rubens]